MDEEDKIVCGCGWEGTADDCETGMERLEGWDNPPISVLICPNCGEVDHWDDTFTPYV